MHDAPHGFRRTNRHRRPACRRMGGPFLGDASSERSNASAMTQRIASRGTAAPMNETQIIQAKEIVVRISETKHSKFGGEPPARQIPELGGKGVPFSDGTPMPVARAR